MKKCCRNTTNKIRRILNDLSHNVIWDIETIREVERKSFIMPADLERISDLIDSLDIEK